MIIKKTQQEKDIAILEKQWDDLIVEFQDEFLKYNISSLPELLQTNSETIDKIENAIPITIASIPLSYLVRNYKTLIDFIKTDKTWKYIVCNENYGFQYTDTEISNKILKKWDNDFQY